MLSADDYNRVRRNWRELANIKNQNKEICVQAIYNNPQAIKFVKNQTKDICALAIELDYTSLVHIDIQTTDLCKLAIDRNPYSIKYVHDLTEELALYAVNNNASVISAIAMQTEEICLIATKSSHNLKHCKIKSYEVCLQAVAKVGWEMMYVPEEHQTDELCEVAIKQYANSFEYVEKPSEHIKRFAVKIEGKNIKHIDNPSEELCILALRNSTESKNYMPHETYLNAIRMISEKKLTNRFIKKPLNKLVTKLKNIFK